MSSARSTRTISRSAFLRSSLALTGGALAGTGLVTSAQAAPTGSGGEHTTSGGKGIELPGSWDGTVFTQSLPTELDGYVASFTTLYDEGPIDELSAKKVEEADGFVNFLPYGTDTMEEKYSVEVLDTVRLDGGPVSVRFADSEGIEIMGEVQLVQTADPHTRGLLLHIVGTQGWSIDLPPMAPIVKDLARVDSPVQVTKSTARTMLANAVALSFAEDGDNPARVSNVQVLDDGQHIVGDVRYRLDGGDLRYTWYGTAVGGDGGWAYLFGALPEGS